MNKTISTKNYFHITTDLTFLPQPIIIFFNTISFQEAAKELVELGGGAQSLLQKAKLSFEDTKYQWCLQLCDALIEIKAEIKEAKVYKDTHCK